MPGGHVEPAANVRNGIAYRHAESDLEPARDDEAPDDDGALITLASSNGSFANGADFLQKQIRDKQYRFNLMDKSK